MGDRKRKGRGAIEGEERQGEGRNSKGKRKRGGEKGKSGRKR